MTRTVPARDVGIGILSEQASRLGPWMEGAIVRGDRSLIVPRAA